MSGKAIILLFCVIFVIQTTKCEEHLKNMFVKRCDDKLAKDKSDAYDKCDSEAADDLKETVKKCAKDICNKDGKFDKLDVCCYAVKPNAMFDCFEKTILDIEDVDAKKQGVAKEDVQKKNLHNAAKIVECYEEIDDDDDK